MQCRSEEECLGLARLLPPMETALLDWLINLMADVVHRLFHESVNKEEILTCQDCLSRIAFAELEIHQEVTLNLKWKQIEEHFHGLEKSLKSRFIELENQEKEFKRKTTQSQQMLKKRQAAVMAKEEAS
ncbi:hypothetical protein Tco_1414325 [Tanacetum coccineum]